VAKITYKSLFTLVENEIQKAQQYTKSDRYTDQLSRNSISPVSSAPNAGSVVTLQELLVAVQGVLEYSSPPRIFDGLNVTATVPYPDNRVHITAGSGTVAGRLYELTEDTELTIPFDSTSSVFFINLHNNAIKIDKTSNTEKLAIARIVVPYPGVSSRVINTKDSTWDAYIVNLHTYDIYGDANGHFEEDTQQLMRDNIGEILADNLIGNIRLSENLKVTNTQGTLELNSDSLKLMNPAGNITLAKFNRNGTFFYNDSGVEVAKFAVDGAYIGNIGITKNSIESRDYISNEKGFRIEDTGYAEFEDVKIRGKITSSVFEYATVSAVGGQLIVSNASTIATDMTASDTSTLEVEDSLFSLDEVLWIKDGVNEEWMVVTDISQAPIYTVTRDIKGQYASNNNPTWSKGVAVVSTGIPGMGFIKLDSTSAYTPYMDINYRNSTTWNDFDTKTRLGNLAGITDPAFGGDLSGFGLYSDNVYLKGSLFATAITTAVSGSRVYMDTSMFVAYDDFETKIFQMYMEAVSGVPYNKGDILMGDYEGGQGFWWDYVNGTFWIRGVLDASDIVVGNMDVKYLTSGTFVDCHSRLDDNSSFQSYNYEEESGGGGSDVGWKIGGNGLVHMTLEDVSGSYASFIKSYNFVDGISGYRIGGDGTLQATLSNSVDSLLQSGNYTANTGWRLLGTGAVDINQDLDMTGFKVTNLNPGINSADSATIQQVTNSITRALVWWSPSDVEASASTAAGANIECPFDGTIKAVRIHAVTQPTGTGITVDIHKNGTTIWTEPNNRLTLPVSTTEATTQTIDVTNVAYGDKFDMFYDIVGSSVAGAKVTVEMIVEIKSIQGIRLSVYDTITKSEWASGRINLIMYPTPFDNVTINDNTSIMDIVKIIVGVEPTIIVSDVLTNIKMTAWNIVVGENLTVSDVLTNITEV